MERLWHQMLFYIQLLQYTIYKIILTINFFSYFVDVRLYKRAKSIADPFAFDQYKKRKIREKIEQERPSRLKIEDNLPKVNRELAARIMEDDGNKKKKVQSNLLKDDRFKVQIDFNLQQFLYYYYK